MRFSVLGKEIFLQFLHTAPQIALQNAVTNVGDNSNRDMLALRNQKLLMEWGC